MYQSTSMGDNSIQQTMAKYMDIHMKVNTFIYKNEPKMDLQLNMKLKL